MASRRKARIYAMQALYSWDVGRTPRDELLKFSWLDPNPGLEDTLAFSRLLVSGALEHIDEVDTHIRDHLDHWKIERLAKVDLAILRLATYSLLFQRDIPASITIDEAIGLAREFGADDSYRFVNGVLDAIRRACEE